MTDLAEPCVYWMVHIVYVLELNLKKLPGIF